ncbi:MAG: hypothetical protein KGH63_02830 [Candidatus Micrarchaeota archaeon]|nr:hypothetical protein [Candidatus Micrarchaeota archaeon]
MEVSTTIALRWACLILIAICLTVMLVNEDPMARALGVVGVAMGMQGREVLLMAHMPQTPAEAAIGKANGVAGDSQAAVEEVDDQSGEIEKKAQTLAAQELEKKRELARQALSDHPPPAA